MVANDGNNENLFRAAIMQSGAPIPVGDITNGQVYYDQIVADTGCAGSSDTLACLRTVPYSRLKPAIDKIPSIFDYQVSLHSYEVDNRSEAALLGHTFSLASPC